MNLFKEKFNNYISPYKGLPKEIYIIFLAKIVNAVGCFVMPLLTLIMTERIGLDSGQTGAILSFSSIIFILPAMIGGKLTDTFGRKRIIITFELLAAVMYIICGFIQPSMTMVYLIILAGAFFGFAMPAHDSLIADLTTPENRSTAYAMSYMGWNIGFAVGPMLGGLLYKNHLDLLFWGDAFTALVALALIGALIPETIGLAKMEIQDSSREMEKNEDGSIFKVLLSRPILIAFAIISMGYQFGYSQWSFLMPTHISQNFGSGVSGQYFGILASFNGLVVMFLTPLITTMFSKVRNIRSVFIGGLLYTVGFGMLGVVDSLAAFFVSVFVFTLGEIVIAISATPFIMNYTPASHRGRMSAVLPMISGFGHMLGPVVMGRTVLVTGIKNGWLIVGMLLAICSYLMYLLEVMSRRVPQEEELEEGIGPEKSGFEKTADMIQQAMSKVVHVAKGVISEYRIERIRRKDGPLNRNWSVAEALYMDEIRKRVLES